MERVGSTILKNRLNAFLAKVASGARIIITDRGKPIAKLIPIDDNGEAADVDELIEELIAKGVAICASSDKIGQLDTPSFSLEIGGAEVAGLLIADRR